MKFYNVPIFFTAVMQQSSSLAGAHLVPNSACIAIGSLVAGYVIRYFGRYYWTVLFCALGPIIQASWLTTWGTETGQFSLWTGLIPGGLGISGATFKQIRVSVLIIHIQVSSQPLSSR